MMADFVERLPPNEAREKPTTALQRSRPFARFKDRLLDYPNIREEWFLFQNEEMLEFARGWLSGESITAELKVRDEE